MRKTEKAILILMCSFLGLGVFGLIIIPTLPHTSIPESVQAGLAVDSLIVIRNNETAYSVYDKTSQVKLGVNTTAAGYNLNRIATKDHMVFSVVGGLASQLVIENWTTTGINVRTIIQLNSTGNLIQIDGDYLYLAEGMGAGLTNVTLLDISGAPNTIVRNGTMAVGDKIQRLVVSGHLACVFTESKSFHVVNFTDPDNPVNGTTYALESWIDSPAEYIDLAMNSSYVYLTYKTNFSVYEIDSGLTISRISFLTLPFGANHIAVCRPTSNLEWFAFITYEDGVGVVKLTPPGSAWVSTLLGYLPLRLNAQAFEEIFIVDRIIYIRVPRENADQLIIMSLSDATAGVSLLPMDVIFWIVPAGFAIAIGMLAFFYLARERRGAREKGNMVWITKRTLLYAGLLLAGSAIIGPIVQPSDIEGQLPAFIGPAVLFVLLCLASYLQKRPRTTSAYAGLSPEEIKARIIAEAEAKHQVEEEQKRHAREEREAQQQAKEEARRKAVDEKRQKAEAEARAKEEAIAREKAEAEAKVRAEEEGRMRKLEQVFRVSTRLSIARIAQVLEMDVDQVWKKVFDWADRFKFTVDGEDLVINKESVDAFVAALDKEFQRWGKDGKV